MQEQVNNIRQKIPLGNISINQQLPPRGLSQPMKEFQERQIFNRQKSNSSLHSNDTVGNSASNKENQTFQGLSSSNQEFSRRSSTCVRNTSTSSSILNKNNMSQALKQSQQYTKQSIIYKCLQQSIDDLVCCKHQDQDIQYFCSTCKVLLCNYCLHSDHSSQEEIDHNDHCLLNVHQFMDYPVLSFLDNNKLLSEVVSQSQFLFTKIKDQTECSKKVLREYLNSLMQWMQKQTTQIQETFDKQMSMKLSGIQKQIDSIQTISSIYKNEWDNWLGSNDISSKSDLEDMCKQFIQTSDDPKESIQNNYDILNDLLKSIPELNIQGFKDLYFRITDAFRFSYDYLITPKMTSNSQKDLISQNVNSNQQNNQCTNSILSLQKSIESIQRQYSNVNIISDYQNNEAFEIKDLISLSEGETDKFLAVGSDQRTVKFISIGKSRCLNTLVRSENDQINNIVPLRDKKHIVLCTNNCFELFSIQTGKTIFREKMNCIQACEIPASRVVIADTSSLLYIYSCENIKNVKKVATLSPNMYATAIDFTILPSDVVIPNSRQSLGDQEIIAIGESKAYSYSSNQSHKPKGVIQLWDLQSLQIIKQLSSTHLNSGVLKLKFIKMCDREKNLHHLLLILTNDSKLLVWDYIRQSSPSSIISLIPSANNSSSSQYNTVNSYRSGTSQKCNQQSQIQIKDFDLIDDDKIIYILGSSILIASISQAKVLGCFCYDTHEGTTQTCQDDNFYDFNSLSNVYNQYESASNGKTCSLYTSLILLGKHSHVEPFIVTSKFNISTLKSQIEMFSK